MKQNILSANDYDDETGAPTGGWAKGTGIDIRWQKGPLGRGADRKEPNGAFVEGVIQVAIDRLEFYQAVSTGRFACAENEQALDLLHEALSALDMRTRRREARGVEGTHAP